LSAHTVKNGSAQTVAAPVESRKQISVTDDTIQRSKMVNGSSHESVDVSALRKAHEEEVAMLKGECDFYYSKLVDIEQLVADGAEFAPAQKIRDVLFATAVSELARNHVGCRMASHCPMTLAMSRTNIESYTLFTRRLRAGTHARLYPTTIFCVQTLIFIYTRFVCAQSGTMDYPLLSYLKNVRWLYLRIGVPETRTVAVITTDIA
jgi:hypothetical protein